MKPSFPQKRNENAVEVPRPLNVETSLDSTKEELNSKEASKLEFGHVTWSIESGIGFFPILFVLRWMFSSEKIATSGWVWSFVCIYSLGKAFSEYQKSGDRLFAISLALFGPFLMLLLTVKDAAFLFFLFAAPLGLSLLLADQMIIHVGSVLRFREGQSSEERKAWQTVWGSQNVWERFASSIGPISDDPAIARNQRELRTYRNTVCYVIGIYLVSLFLFILIPNKILAPLVASLGFGILVATFGILNTTNSTSSSGNFLGRIADGLSFWFNYNSHASESPGVVKSPFGDFELRQRKGQFVSLVFIMTLLPAVNYFPIPVQLSSATTWMLSSDEDYELPTREDVLVSLSPSEARFYRRMPENQKERFLQPRMQRLLKQQEAEYSYQLSYPPEYWPVHALHNTSHAPSFFLWALVLGIALSIILPPLMFLGLMYTVCGRPLLFFIQRFDVEWEHRKTSAVEGNPDWEDRFQRLMASDNELESKQLFLGTKVASNTPILFDRKELTKHMVILGGSGSGKTSRGIAPMASQLIRGNVRFPCSVVILDLKGEPYLFEGVKDDARKANLPFKWFTNVTNKATHAFNPLTQSHLSQMTMDQRSQALTTCLGLEHGEEYGASFYAGEARDIVRKLFNLVPVGTLDSFEHFADALSREKQFGSNKLYDTPDQKKNAQQLRNKVRQLSAFLALNATKADVDNGKLDQSVLDNAIDAVDIVTNPSVTYFYVSSTMEPETVRDIGKFALYSILHAATLREPKDRLPVFLFIDEFQEAISKDLERFFALARSAEIGVIFSTQSYAQLNKGSMKMGPIIIENTNLKQFFTFSDNDFRQMVLDRSGLLGELEPSDIFESDVPVVMSVDNRFNTNDLLRVTARPEQCYLEVRDNNAFANFDGLGLIAETDFHISETEFTRRQKKAKWPEASIKDGTFCNSPGNHGVDESNTEATNPDEPGDQPQAPKKSPPQKDSLQDKFG